MIEALKFVQGAVSTKNLVPEMKHFVIKDGTVRAFNGTLALCSPIDFGVDCAPLAVPMVKAIEKCTDVASLGMTPAQRLRVSSGKFRVFIECVDLRDLPDQQPEGDRIDIDGERLMDAVAKLVPFVGNDASRPWTNGILLRGQSAFATNNVCLIEYWLGTQFPLVLNIPMSALREMLRIGQAPTHMQASTHSVTFHYPDGRWVRTQLFSTEWPDLSPILDQPANAQPVPEGLFDALDTLKPFLQEGNRIYVKDGTISTALEEDLGARVDVPGLQHDGIYHLNMFRLLEPVANTIDFSRYPAPLLFYGDRVRGAIVGQRA